MDCVYILHSQKLNRFYIGYTADFEARMAFHKTATAHKFTAKADGCSFTSPEATIQVNK